MKLHRLTYYVETQEHSTILFYSAAELLVLRDIVEQNPELFLDEIQAWFEHSTGIELHISTIDRYLNKMGITWKKVCEIVKLLVIYSLRYSFDFFRYQWNLVEFSQSHYIFNGLFSLLFILLKNIVGLLLPVKHRLF